MSLRVINHVPLIPSGSRREPTPLHDEASAIAALQAREQRQIKFIDATFLLCLGIVLGALLATAIFLATSTKP